MKFLKVSSQTGLSTWLFPRCAHTALELSQPGASQALEGKVAVCPSVTNPSWRDRHHGQLELLGIDVTGRKHKCISVKHS